MGDLLARNRMVAKEGAWTLRVRLVRMAWIHRWGDVRLVGMAWTLRVQSSGTARLSIGGEIRSVGS